MIIGLISDTHGSSRAVELAAERLSEAELWLHAGDLLEDAEYLRLLTDKQVVRVAGNCDGWSPAARQEEFLTAAGHKIWLTHGHGYGVKASLANLTAQARHYAADIVVYGHSHIAAEEWLDGILLINPGSASRPRDGGRPSIIKLTVTEAEVIAEKIYLS